LNKKATADYAVNTELSYCLLYADTRHHSCEILLLETNNEVTQAQQYHTTRHAEQNQHLRNSTMGKMNILVTDTCPHKIELRPLREQCCNRYPNALKKKEAKPRIVEVNGSYNKLSWFRTPSTFKGLFLPCFKFPT
jgi:hypothetical protein